MSSTESCPTLKSMAVLDAIDIKSATIYNNAKVLHYAGVEMPPVIKKRFKEALEMLSSINDEIEQVIVEKVHQVHKRKKGSIAEAVYESAKGLHEGGLIDSAQMQKFDEIISKANK